MSVTKPSDKYFSLFQIFLAETGQMSDETLRDVTKKAISTINTPLYAAIVHFETDSLERALLSHELILEEARYILFLDYLYSSLTYVRFC